VAKKTVKAVVRKPPLPAARPRDLSFRWLAGILLLTLLAFFPSLFNGFVNWDDYAYIVDNPLVKSLSWTTIRHLFDTDTYVVGNYHPLTVLSHCIEYSIAGLNPLLYHLDNLLLHLGNVALVFLLCRRLSPALPVAVLTALLFAVHPMRVESVTWAAERKDVLYTLFFLLSTLSYLSYLEKKYSPKHYLLCLLLFVCSLLSKGQAVVLPLTFILLDYYRQRKPDMRALLEKIPFFALSLLFGLLAMSAQHTSLTGERLEKYSIPERLLFAGYGLLQYLYKLILPVKLSCFYGYPVKPGGELPASVYLASAAVLLLLVLLFLFRKRRLLLFGALYFLLTIVIVLQLLPVGDAIIADRYTYIPYLGLFFIAAHLLAGLLEKPSLKTPVISGIAIYFVILCGLTFSRTRDWRDSETLWTDVIRKYPETALAYSNRGVVKLNSNRAAEALEDFNKALKYNPRYVEAFNNRGNALGKMQLYDQEIEAYTQALRIAPGYTTARFNRGLAYANANRHDLALKDYEEVQKQDPLNPKLYYSKAMAYRNLGRDSLALAGYTRAAELDPSFSDAWTNRGNIYFRQGRFEEAIRDYNEALRIDPSSGKSWYNRSAAWFSRKDYQKALEDALKAQSLGYNVDARYIEYIKSGIQQGNDSN
jgi:protein O-mannosyl-transferase